MARLSVRKLNYEGQRYFYESPWLGDGVNILEGENGTGKTTFSELIYFGLGGRVESFQRGSRTKHNEITSDKDNFVQLTIEVEDGLFKLRRFIDTNDVGIENASGTVEVLPVIRQQSSDLTFSDWLLERLGIEPVLLYLSAAYSGKISFNDLARLIYHDQSVDPSAIYKAADIRSFVSDSQTFRKAVFEILVGKTFQALYAGIAKLKDLEKQRAGATTTLEYFRTFIQNVRPHQEDLNLIFLDKRITEVQAQIQRALAHRGQLARHPSRTSSVDTTSQKNTLLSVEMESADASRRESELLSEQARLERLRAEMVLEVTHIKKMMFAHDKLNLFSMNTCPYCLREVARELNRCVCGAVVDEKQYERFFYNSSEYLLILKSKQRNVDTIDAAIASCREEAEECRKQTTHLRDRKAKVWQQIADVVDQSDAVVDIVRFNEIDEHIVSLRTELSSLEQQRELEMKREELESKAQDIETRYSAALTAFNDLQAQADKEMAEQRRKFSAKFNELMRENVQKCRTASIDPEYMPILNTGEYREASAEVPKRLFYFLTLLYMSLDDPDVRFPRFLLIDTPETAGIDQENLIRCLEEVRKLVDSHDPPECQVILTTGVNKYPADCKDRVFATLTKTNRLLKPRQQSLLPERERPQQ
jgi:hypothetical protein